MKKPVAIAALLLMVLLSLQAWAARGTLPPAYNPSGTGQVAITTCSGAPCMKRDGVGPWEWKGVNSIARTAPSSYIYANEPQNIWGMAHYGYSTLVAIKALSSNFDTIRFLLSQAALSPSSGYYDPTYLPSVVNAIQLARAAGFTVIATLNWQTNSILQPSIPDADTILAWQQLAPQLDNDQGIIFEIFNEPFPLTGSNCGPPYAPSSSDWAAWQSGMNSVIAAVRALGAMNVIFADGLCYSKTVSASYPLTDPLSNMGLAVHMYFSNYFNTPSEYDSVFFTACAAMNVPCQATEFNVSDQGGGCDANAGQLPGQIATMFSYLEGKGSGFIYHAIDKPNTMMVALDQAHLGNGVSSNIPENLYNWTTCAGTPAPWGAGLLFIQEVISGRWNLAATGGAILVENGGLLLLESGGEFCLEANNAC